MQSSHTINDVMSNTGLALDLVSRYWRASPVNRTCARFRNRRCHSFGGSKCRCL